MYVVGYDYENSCDTAPEVCLGVPYFNWGPEYLKVAKNVANDYFISEFTWAGPDWDDLNNKDTSSIGFKMGNGLSDEEKNDLDKFIKELASGDLNLFKGPLNFQDGTTYLAEGKEASDNEIWYTSQLLMGMTGDSK